MCLRFIFLLIARVGSWLRLSRHAEALLTAEILILRHSSPYWTGGSCVPITSSTSCHQAIFVDQATDLSLSSDAVLAEVNRLG